MAKQAAPTTFSFRRRLRSGVGFDRLSPSEIDEGQAACRDGGDRADDVARETGHAAYVRYMSSTAWLASAARLGELSASGHRCRLCDRGPPEVRLHVHHRTYARFGRELQRDLTTLCEECHRPVTDELRARGHAARRLPPPRDVATYSSMRILETSEWIDDDLA